MAFEHSGFAMAQRGAKRQPDGTFPTRGTWPGMPLSRVAPPDNFGTEAMSALV
jgi:hypothetical protein